MSYAKYGVPPPRLVGTRYVSHHQFNFAHCHLVCELYSPQQQQHLRRCVVENLAADCPISDVVTIPKIFLFGHTGVVVLHHVLGNLSSKDVPAIWLCCKCSSSSSSTCCC